MEKENITLAHSKKRGAASVYKLAVTGMCAALICVLSVISIPIQPVPFTLSVFAIFLTGGLLSPKYAFCAALLYVLIGAVGLPVYSGFGAGPGILFGLTGGYLMSYPLMAAVVALSVKLFKGRSALSLSLGMIAALALCYLLGTAWFVFQSKMSVGQALALCVVPFILFDLLKAALAELLLFAL
ncbi:MAG: biotin transporter BioY, partial [Oscillospiraceae bacterium]